MADRDFYCYLNEFQATPKARRWWPKAVAICAICGGIYGAAVGSAISTTAGATDVIGIAAAVMAVLCGVPGSRYGVFFDALNRVRFGKQFFGTIAAIGGSILGGFFGMVAVMPLGAILGALGGWFFMQSLLRRFFLRRLLGGFVGAVLGACLGATIAALQKNQSAALVGIAWGLGIGAVVGQLPLLLFAKMMDSLAARHHPESTIIDTTVIDVPNDQIEGPNEPLPRKDTSNDAD